MSTTGQPLRVPIAVAATRGVSWLNETASSRRVLLTRFGRVDSVVDSAERLDAVATTVAEARREVVERLAATALERTDRRSLTEVCEHLGIDPEKVHARTQQLRTAT
jgi:DNA polymerase III epsilon subunit-like protein